MYKLIFFLAFVIIVHCTLKIEDCMCQWQTDVRLTNDPGYSFTSFNNAWCIASSGSVVHVVWQDVRDGNYEIYCKRSTDAGVSWGPDTRLTNYTAYSTNPSVAVSGSNVHIVWFDFRDGNREIYYKNSIDGGNTWSSDTRLTNNTDYSFYPSVAVSGSVVHIVWHDYRDGNWEIYYKRDPTGNTIGIKNITSEIPSSYSLQQNYPNPFNPITNVKFQIINSDNVKITVFDITGKEVAILVNEQLAPGTYETTFDASMLTSGVYFYRLETTDFVQTNKMILLK
jgi:hypothetical protein